MGKRVVIIASGETERRALPHLLSHMAAEGIDIVWPIRTPPSGRITGEIAYKIIVSAWRELEWITPPDKFIVLVDADGKDPAAVVEAIKQQLGKTAAVNVPATVLVTAAKWHLEAWFFADPAALRAYVGGSLGSVDASKPDEIINPKLCLKGLIDETYTSRVAEEIAQRLDAVEVRAGSPSFVRFEGAVRNGSASSPAAG
ncbi:MAG: DUF4276 family protein [Polyangiaceae bacterium]|nr:DUF4276 family protein [Polyangiaceae bacterium]